MGLAHPEGQALVHRGAERNLVDEPAIDPRHRDRSAGAADIDHLAQDVRAVALQHGGLLHPVVDRIERAGRVRLEPDRVDALLRPLAACQLADPLEHALVVEVDRDGALLRGHGEALGHVVDHRDLARAHHQGGEDAELADRPRAPDDDRVGRLDLAIGGGLPAGRQDVAEEQHLLVAEPRRDLDRADIGIGHADIFRLPAGIAARQVRVAVEPGGGVAEEQVRGLGVAVGALAEPRSCRAGTDRTRRKRW
ncbi:hypothetical protein BH23PSE1_BH23PSE1_08560 [soil metagenome]